MMTRLRLFFLPPLIASLLLLVNPALAQFSSAIQGTVTDASQGAVPNANVVVKNNATGIVRETTTANDGLYRVPSLGPGTYTVTVQKAGFSTNEQSSVSLAINEVARVDVSLSVGSVSDRVDVSEKVVLVETEEGRVS